VARILDDAGEDDSMLPLLQYAQGNLGVPRRKRHDRRFQRAIGLCDVRARLRHEARGNRQQAARRPTAPYKYCFDSIIFTCRRRRAGGDAMPNGSIRLRGQLYGPERLALESEQAEWLRVR
jgi:hypothetical protein